MARRGAKHDDHRVIVKLSQDLRTSSRRLRLILTVAAGLVVAGGLLRLALDDEVVAVSYQEIDQELHDEPAP